METEQIEKEIMELREKLEENNKDISIRKIDYYDEFQIINQTNKYMSFNEKGIFIVAKENEDDKTRYLFL